MNTDVSILNSEGLKDFRKLKGVNWAVRIALGLVVGVIVYKLLPYGVTFAENLFQLSWNLGKAFFIGTSVFFAANFLWANKLLLKKMRESLSRKLWTWFIYNDPLDYISGVIQDFIGYVEKIQAAIEKLIAVRDRLKALGESIIEEARGNMKRAKAIMDSEKDQENAALLAYMSQSGMQTSEDIISSYSQIDDNIEVMREIAEAVDRKIQGMQFDLKMMKINLEVANAKSDAAQAAQSILEGNDEAAHLEIARTAYMQQVAAGTAKFKEFMTRVKPILDAEHIDKVMATKAGREILDEFKKGATDIGGLKNFDEQLKAFKEKNKDVFTSTNARERIQTQRPEAIRTKYTNKFSGLN